MNNIENAKTVVELVVDRSYSMESVREETVAGINNYLKELRQEGDADEIMVGLTLFDGRMGETRMERVFFKRLSDVSPLGWSDFVPSGSTPLYDAVGQVVRSIEVSLEQHEVSPNVLVVIVTDGQNTDSQGYQPEQVREMLASHEKDGWTVVYLGANQDAWAVGSTFGVAKGNAITYSTNRMDATFRGLAASTVAYASASAMAPVGQAYQTRSFFSDGGVDKDSLT